MTVNKGDFTFLSTEPTDKVVFFNSGTINVASGAFATFDIPHSHGKSFVPSIRYTIDGNDWYQDGDSDVYYQSSPMGYWKDVSMTAKANSTKVVVTYTATVLARNGVKYEIYGIAKNV